MNRYLRALVVVPTGALKMGFAKLFHPKSFHGPALCMVSPHSDIGAFLEKVRALGFKIKLDTNGSFPDRLMDIVRAGLVDRVAMDIKNSPELYAKTAGVDGLDLDAIERSKDFLLSGSVDYEFRTTVVKGLHTRESIVDAAKWISGAKEYYLQQFKDSGHVLDIRGLGAYDEAEMHSLADAAAEYVPSVQVRGV